MIKLICFVRRKPGMTPDEFHARWRQHGEFLRSIPELARHIVRYEQNHRTASDYERGDPDYDGVAVQWYRSVDDFWAFVAEPVYAEKLAPDEREFLDPDGITFLLTEDGEPFIEP